MHNVHLEISDGIIRLYTDDKPDKIIVDGEIVRRQVDYDYRFSAAYR